nr:hypothetical protein [Candidatus Sigynarchaeota archaeon]
MNGFVAEGWSVVAGIVLALGPGWGIIDFHIDSERTRTGFVT